MNRLLNPLILTASLLLVCLTGRMEGQTNGLLREVYLNITGNTLADLFSSPNYPSRPDLTEVLTNSFETPTDWNDYYGQRVSGFVIPPMTGNYVFWISSDDQSVLNLSTDENPANKIGIANVASWTSPRQWDSEEGQVSQPIALQAGKLYYIEALMKEGSGGDNLAVRWQMPDGTMEEPIPAVRFALASVPVNPPVITLQPTNTTVLEAEAAAFRVEVSNLDPQHFQWLKNDVPILGATNRYYTNLNATVFDNGARYSCSITNALGGVISDVAILTVIPDTTPPVLVSVINTGVSTLQIRFSEPVTVLEDTASFSLDNNVVIQSVVSTTDRAVIQLKTSPLALRSTYRLSVRDVVDRSAASNPIFPNSSMLFVTSDYAPQDIGNSKQPGTFLQVADGFNLSAAGSDIGGVSDQFQFTYQERIGNFDYMIKIQSFTASDPFAKAGLMMRESLNANSRYASVLATPSIAGMVFQYRAATGGVSTVTGALPVNYPDTWVRLQRNDNKISGYGSFDGASWFNLGTVTIAITNKYYFGIALSSHNGTNTAAVEIRDLSAVTGAPGQFELPAGYEPLAPSSRKTPIIISEIMYHPAPRADGKNLEYVELFNADAFPVDISGYRLAGAVEYTIPSGTMLGGGAFLVVAKSPADLQSVYGLTGGPVLGGFTNRLSNNSESLRLMHRLGAELLKVAYSSEAPWPAAADGTGHSLVLSRPSYGEGSPKAWDASSLVGGSPGKCESLVVANLNSLVINEFLANSEAPALDYIELFNKSTNMLDISGCILTDEASIFKFTIPQGTKLLGGAFYALTEDRLGFALNSSGESVYLYNPAKTRVLDAIRFGPTASGIATGRYPDGAPNFHELVSNTPSKPNSTLLIRDVVINEIMYNPISNDDAGQYVELYNRGTNAIDLSGWRFQDGIKFKFPAITIIPAGGYLVVAQNAARLQEIYPFLNATNLVGDFTGSLGNGGDKISLAMPVQDLTTNADLTIVTNYVHAVVDEVAYVDGGRWGAWSDGGGSSLELIDAHADNRQPSNWSDSDESKRSQWTTIENTGVLDLGDGNFQIDSIQIVALGVGECLVDDIEVLDASGLNLVSNSTFEGGLGGWVLRGSHKHSDIQVGEGYQSSRSLHLRATSRGDTGPNQIYSPLITPLHPGNVATIRAKVRWLRGATEILFRLHGNFLEAYGSMNVPQGLGTPGTKNTRYARNAGPAIFDVSHTPVLPAAFEPVVVKARVQDPDGVGSVQLYYRYDPATSTNVVKMLDDGKGADEMAGDGIYSGAIPGQPSNTMIAFSIKASDKAAVSVSSSFPDNAPVRECLVRFGETQPSGSFGTYRIWFTQATLDEWASREQGSNELLDATFAYGSYRAIYNMGTMYSGSPYHWNGYDSPLGRDCNYNMTMPADDKFLGSTDFILNETSNMSSDATAQREQTAYWMIDKLGLPTTHRRFVNLYVNGVRRAFIFEDAQQPSGEFVREWFPNDPDGDLHKAEDWFEFDTNLGFDNFDATLENFVDADGRKKLARYRWTWRKRAVKGSENDFSNLFALVDAVNTRDTNAYTGAVEALVDVEQWMRIMALRHAVGDWDSYGYRRGKNMYAYKPQQGKWQLLNWDIAFSFGLGDGPTQDLFSNAHFDGSIDPVTDRMFKNPPFRRMYLRAFQDILDGPFSDALVNPVMAAKYSGLVANNVRNVAAPDPIKNFIAARRAYIQKVLATNAAPFAITSNGGGPVTTSQNMVTLEGTAPVGVASIQINGVAYPPRWLTLTNWQIKLPVRAGDNTLVVSGYDTYGNSVTNASVSVEVKYPGALELPQDKIVFNEIMYHPDSPGAAYVELFNASVSQAFDLSRCQIRGLDFTFPDGTYILPQGFLVVAKDLQVFQQTYGTDIPVAGIYNGQLQNGGETLALVQSGLIPSEDVVISRVRYDNAAPWPASADGSGASLQVVDPNQDISRVGNWAAVGTNGLALPRWQYAAVTGIPAGTRLLLTLGSKGQVYLDDLSLVAGVVPGLGANLLVNGGFESPFAGSWTVSGDYTNSATSSDFIHRGGYALKLAANPVGTNLISGEFSQTIPQGLVQGTTYTLSYWYLPSDSGADLTIRLDGAWNPGNQELVSRNSATPGKAAMRTPGKQNSIRSTIPPFPSVWINEIQPENVGAVVDNAGQKDPWLELFNSGSAAVSLDGYYLTDSYNNLTTWAFPSGSVIQPGQFLVVWVDGQTGQTTTAELHANFRIAPTGSIALARRQNGQIAVVDYLNYSSIVTGMAYGLKLDGDKQNLGILSYATPGSSNSIANVPIKVRINEWMADNTKTIADTEDGSFNDWFELYNSSDVPVDLSGYVLTDVSTNLSKSIIPNGVRIGAHGFLLVWADGKSKYDTLGELHANFKLSKSGDFIGLYTPDKRLVDAVTFGAQSSDVSQGRYPDGVAEPFVLFAQSSPGASNPNPAGTGKDLRIVEIHSNVDGVTLKVNTEPGKLYRLQYANDLMNPSWQNIGDSINAYQEQTLFNDTGNSDKTQRFYRVINVMNP